MFESQTYDTVLKRNLDRVRDDVSKRPGDVVYDMLAPICWEISDAYFALDHLADLMFPDSATGDYLDRWGWVACLPRNPATSTTYKVEFVGTTPLAGTRFFADSQYLLLVPDGEGGFCLETEGTGKATASILPGTAAVPCRTVRGLESATIGDVITPGVDVEEDEHYRERIREKLAGPAENGNKQHYKTWCESVTGVGRAKIIPLFAGENTVMAVLFDPDGKPCAESVVEAVQEYVDPMTLGKTVVWNGDSEFAVGDGLGDGVANIGAHFRAMAAESVEISVSFNAVLATGKTISDAEKEATEAVGAYLRGLALGGMEDDGSIVRLTAIGAALTECESISDYDGLALNGQPFNVTIGSTCAPELKGVQILGAL